MIVSESRYAPLISWKLWLAPLVAASLLIVISRFNFLAFHTFAELFTIVISFLVFAVAWSTRRQAANNFLLFLACGYFSVGMLDLLHVLVYKGMNVFVEGSGNLSVQFWLSARGIEALALLGAPFAAKRPLNGYWLAGTFSAVAAGLTLLILTGKFPVGYIEDQGLTTFKIYSEYLIDAVLAAALIALFRFGEGISSKVKILLAGSIVLTMCAELAFTYYVDVYGLSNLVGHVLKMFSFWLVFNAIVVSHLREPYASLQKSQAQARNLFDHTEVSIWNMDLSRVYDALEQLRREGVTDLAKYLEGNKQAVVDMPALIRVLEVNQATLTLFGAKDQHEFMTDALKIIVPEALGSLADQISAIWDGEKVFRSEMTFKTLDGRIVHGVVSFNIPDKPEDFRSVPVSIIDISDRKLAEDQMLEARDQAEAASRAKSEFLASMSHELRTPLNAILGFAQILQAGSKEPLNREQDEQVGHILEGGNHLLDLVNQVLDLARIEADQLDLIIEDVNANEVIANCIGLVSPLAAAGHIQINDEFSAGPLVLLQADQLRVRQAMINILSNAIKYNKAGGVVTIEGKVLENDFLRLKVTDTGFGIAEKNHERAFRRFDRLGLSTSATAGGAGIGLAVTKFLVEKMAGQIGYESEENVGTEFWIELPLASNENIFTWDDSMRVGIDAIDKDHQDIVKLLNRVSRIARDAEDLETLIDEMISSITRHFERENAILEICEMPKVQEHREIHQELVSTAFDLAGKWKQTRAPSEFRVLREFFLGTLRGHLLDADYELSEYAQGKDKEIRKALDKTG